MAIEIGDLRRQLKSLMGAHSRLGARHADWIMASVLGISKAEMIGQEAAIVPPRLAARALRLGSHAVAGWPLQYLVRSVQFHNVRLFVGPDTLIPRPETEELVGSVIGKVPGVAPRILDLCTGGGAIALALKNHFPHASVHGVDISDAALAVAVENAARLDLDVSWSKLDVRKPELVKCLRHTPQTRAFDVVVSNPPYIDDEERSDVSRNVLRFEPSTSLFADCGGLGFYYAIVSAARDLLVGSGLLALEVHEDRADKVRVLAVNAGFRDTRVLRDTSGKLRILTGVLDSRVSA